MIPVLSRAAAVTFYLDFMAFFLMAGLQFLSSRLKTDKTDARLFSAMCINAMVAAIFGMLIPLHFNIPYSWTSTSLMISKTLFELALLLVSYELVLFTDFMLYGSLDHLKRKYKLFSIPVLVFTLLLIINFFTGIVFTVNTERSFDEQPLSYVILLFEICCFIAPVFMLGKYFRTSRRLRFFHVMPILLPSVTGFLISKITPFHTGVLGISVGLTCLYFSMMNAWRFEDEDTGFFHPEYLTKVAELTEKGEYKYKSAIIFETEGDETALVSILREELPKKTEIVLISKGKYAVLTEKADKCVRKLLSRTVGDTTSD